MIERSQDLEQGMLGLVGSLKIMLFDLLVLFNCLVNLVF